MIIFITRDISGFRNGRKLKLLPKKFLDKRWLLMMSSLGLRDKRAFHRKWIYSFYYYRRSMYADDSSHEVWYTIHADYVTSGYFTNWSLFYWKCLPTGISGPRHRMTSKLSAKKLLTKRWLIIMSPNRSREKSPFYKPGNKFRVFVITEETGLL